VLQTVIEHVRADAAAARETLPELAASVTAAARWLETAVTPVLRDPGAAQHHADRIGRMVSDVVTAAELLMQASIDPRCHDVAAAFIEHRVPVIEMHARHLTRSAAARMARCARLIDE
jgi:hypothetical protein